MSSPSVPPDGGDRPGLKAGYNVWFGLQHVTLTGFRHSGRRESCPRCNPALRPPSGEPGDAPSR
jgi:hypothetical protein